MCTCWTNHAGDMSARRKAAAFVFEKSAVSKLFSELGPRYMYGNNTRTRGCCLTPITVLDCDCVRISHGISDVVVAVMRL